MFARSVLRRTLPATCIAAIVFAGFVWYSTAKMQRGAEDVLATMRSLKLGDEALVKMLKLDMRYPAEFFETFADKGCEASHRCFSFYFDNSWLRRLRMATAKGVTGSFNIDERGRVKSLWLYGAEYQQMSGFPVTAFSVRQGELPLDRPMEVMTRGPDAINIMMTPAVPEWKRNIALDVDLSFLSKPGRQLQSVQQAFRQDLRKLRE